MTLSHYPLCLVALFFLASTTALEAFPGVRCRYAAPSEIPSLYACVRLSNQIALASFHDRRVYTWGRHLRDTPTTRKLPHTWSLPPDAPGDEGECVYTADVLDIYDEGRSQGTFTLMDVALQMRRLYKACLPVEENPRNPRIGYAL